MTATYCLGAFATELRTTPPAEWSRLVKAQPAVCPHGCRVGSCNVVCRDYARMQWRIAANRKRAGR